MDFTQYLKKLVASILTIFVTLFSQFTNAEVRIDHIAKLHSSYGSCQSKVWDGFLPAHLNILYLSKKEGQGHFWNGQLQVLEKVELEEIPTSFFSGRYLFESFRGKKVTVINLDEISSSPKFGKIDPAFSLAIHESFHWQFQMGYGWAAVYLDSARVDETTEWEPRYYRKMIELSLKDNLLDRLDLGAGSHWYHKWISSEDSSESLRDDILEGTAYYVEVISSVYLTVGCDEAFDGAVFTEALLSSLETFFPTQTPISRALESYQANALALILLTEKGEDIASKYNPERNWAQLLEDLASSKLSVPESQKLFHDYGNYKKSAVSPLTLLFSDIQPINSPDRDDIREFYLRNSK